MCFALSTFGAGGETRLESSIKKLKPQTQRKPETATFQCMAAAAAAAAAVVVVVVCVCVYGGVRRAA